MIIALAAPLLSPADPFEIIADPFLKPSGEHLFGTDSLGRSIWAGLVHGSRTTLIIAIVATLASLAFGTAVGAIAGYFGGLVDDTLMRITEFFQTIPSFIFAIVLVGNSVLVETVFSRPGLGKMMVGAITQRDYMTLQSVMIVYAGLVVAINLITDLSYGLFDPRVRYR